VHTAGDDCLVVAVGQGHGAEAGHSIGDNIAAGRKVRLAQSEIDSELQRSILSCSP
jgi:hypothetical protein